MSFSICNYSLEDRKYEMIALCHVLPCFFQWLSLLATTEDTPFDVRQVGSSETKVHGDEIISHHFPVKSDSSKFIDLQALHIVWMNFIASDIIYVYTFTSSYSIAIYFNIYMYLLVYSWFWTIVLCVPAFLGVLKQWNFIGGYQGKSTSPYQIQVLTSVADNVLKILVT